MQWRLLLSIGVRSCLPSEVVKREPQRSDLNSLNTKNLGLGFWNIHKMGIGNVLPRKAKLVTVQRRYFSFSLAVG